MTEFKDWDGNTRDIYQALYFLNQNVNQTFQKEQIANSLDNPGGNPDIAISLKRDGTVDEINGKYQINQKGKNELKRIKTTVLTPKFQILKTIVWLTPKENHNDPRSEVWKEMRLDEGEMIELKRLLFAAKLVNHSSDGWSLQVTTEALLLKYSGLEENGKIKKSDAQKLRDTVFWFGLICAIAALFQIIEYAYKFKHWWCGCN